jgi:hypothetical protein
MAARSYQYNNRNSAPIGDTIFARSDVLGRLPEEVPSS